MKDGKLDALLGVEAACGEDLNGRVPTRRQGSEAGLPQVLFRNKGGDTAGAESHPGATSWGQRREAGLSPLCPLKSLPRCSAVKIAHTCCELCKAGRLYSTQAQYWGGGSPLSIVKRKWLVGL